MVSSLCTMRTLLQNWRLGDPVHLETRRLVVRTLTHEDVDARLLGWSSDPAIARNVWRPPLPPTAYFHGLVNASDQTTRFTFLIVHRSTDRAIGYAKLQVDTERRTQIPTVALGEREYWRAELGAEAGHVIQDFAFGVLPVDRAECRVYAENESVRKRLLHAGYRETDVYSEGTPAGPGREVHVYCIERDAWHTLSPAIEARLAEQPDTPPTRVP